ncbi:unnamed protein product [Caenorhabditis auriculariae]|uniref:Copper transport protein n=1 Tax=Caenorhabditis auriculariae TaxID=2777116 RepID=A0A8S1GNN1_9PELO|nr:unnamed protein product [Caenorhabditis auriculariae]
MLRRTFFLLALLVQLSFGAEKVDLVKDAEDFIRDVFEKDTKADVLPGQLVTPPQHDHGSHDHGSHAASGHGDHVMKMYFHGGYEEVILFDCWRIDSLIGLLVSFAAIFVMGATYEGIKWFRVFLLSQPGPSRSKNLTEIPLHTSHGTPGVATCTPNRAATEPLVIQNESNLSLKKNSLFFPPRLIEAVLYIIQLVLAYWLMLIVMTYNTWLSIAVVLGAGFGHWIFAVLKLRNADGEAADSFVTDACH